MSTYLHIFEYVIQKLQARARTVAQVVECLPSKYKALSLNPNTVKITTNTTNKTQALKANMF
jgi:hypothetical protein